MKHARRAHEVLVLVSLQVRDLAIIHALEVGFGAGLNVITGETGAGKSMLVDALVLAIGGRASPDLVRTGAEAAEVTAVFDVRRIDAVRAKLREAGIADDDELFLRRVVASESAGGRSRAYVNGRLVSQAQLAQIAAGLVDITSQHEQQTLTDPAAHLAMLDAAAGLADERDAMRRAFDAFSAASSELDACVRNLRDRNEREDLLRFQLREIDESGAVTTDEAALQSERDRLQHATRLRDGAARAEEILYSADSAVIDVVGDAVGLLADLARFDPTLRALHEQLDAARIQIEDVGQELGRYARSVTADPERLAELNERHERLSRVKRKYGPTLADVAAFRARADNDLKNLEAGDQRIHALEVKLEAARTAATAKAKTLSAARRRAAMKLSSAVSKELQSLGMGDARIVIDVVPTSPASGDLSIDGMRLGATGVDRAEFLIAPNRGEDPRPLRKVASGGELSRALLAVKRVLIDASDAHAYVFDEVDAGVGGAIAEVIGLKLKSVAKKNQALVITHLPQIAVQGDRHLVVGKRTEAGRTVVEVRTVTAVERTDEIARMLGGVKITDKTRAAAREMLKSAR